MTLLFAAVGRKQVPRFARNDKVGRTKWQSTGNGMTKG
jgi:hypothetical protein